MENILLFFFIMPLVIFTVNICTDKRNEFLLSTTVFAGIGLHTVLGYAFIIYWISQGTPVGDFREISFYKSNDYNFFIDLHWDDITAIYFFVGSTLTFLVAMYSRSYMHREHGYKRFFNNIAIFYAAYIIIIFSGNLETMFIGWEMLGISSFLLIAFYQSRYLPVKNAVKVFSIYRIGDIGLLLAMWACHHLFNGNITFLQISDSATVHSVLEKSGYAGIFISIFLLLPAMVKSALFPFSSWLSRAMEGPTPSSAIFYGSLSVHMGVFLMLRTQSIWENFLSIKILLGILGLVTAVLGTMMARVQATVKSQVAYASIAQIGTIFIEIALGLKYFALIHFAGNAFLRTYQLLVSPSIVTYLIKEQFYTLIPRKEVFRDSFYDKVKYSLYLLCLKEFNLDNFMYMYLWNPLKWLGKKTKFLSMLKTLYVLGFLYLAFLCLYWQRGDFTNAYRYNISISLSVIGLVCVLHAFVERTHARMSWILLVFNHFWVFLAVAFNEQLNLTEALLYLSGISIAGILGLFILIKLKYQEGTVDLDRFHGYFKTHPRLSLIFLGACLGVTGFPITTSFIGEDLIFEHIQPEQLWLAVFCSMSFVIDGIAAIRIYARVFLGPHSKSLHEMAYRSA